MNWSMAKHDVISKEFRLARWIKPKLMAANDEGEIEVDEAGKPLMIFPQAYELREDEEYLSVTAVELFGCSQPENLEAAADAFRASQLSKKLSKKGAFALAVADAVSKCCEAHGHKIRILEEPVADNIGHVAIRRYPHIISELQSELADSVFTEFHFYRDLI